MSSPANCLLAGPDCSAQGKLSFGLCNKHYLRWRTHGDPGATVRTCTPNDHCFVEDCPNPPRSAGAHYCEMHYGRLRRNGHPEALIPRPTRGLHHTRKAKYIRVKAPGHPLADSAGWVDEQRLVLYERIGPGTHRCHWCGEPIDWATLHAAHLDLDPQNNVAGNLVPACFPCNGHRAL